jgi:hypothetical protein
MADVTIRSIDNDKGATNPDLSKVWDDDYLQVSFPFVEKLCEIIHFAVNL